MGKTGSPGALCVPGESDVWRRGVIRAAKNIVGGCFVKNGKGDQDVGGDVPVALLIAEILRLGHVQVFSYLPLCQVVVFP